jgi:hypothetical protein
MVVLEELGTRIPQITLQDFMDFLAPPQPEFDIEATMEKLKTSGVLTALGRWKAFDKEPKDQSGREDVVFKPMSDIFNATVTAIIEDSNLNFTARDCALDFLQNPNITPKSSDRGNTSKPDGYLLMKDRVREDKVSWADVVLSCEYKREGGVEELDDVSITL